MGQFLNLFRPIVKNGLPFGKERQLFELGVRVGDVTTDASGDLHEFGGLAGKLTMVRASCRIGSAEN